MKTPEEWLTHLDQAEAEFRRRADVASALVLDGAWSGEGIFVHTFDWDMLGDRLSTNSVFVIDRPVDEERMSIFLLLSAGLPWLICNFHAPAHLEDGSDVNHEALSSRFGYELPESELSDEEIDGFALPLMLADGFGSARNWGERREICEFHLKSQGRVGLGDLDMNAITNRADQLFRQAYAPLRAQELERAGAGLSAIAKDLGVGQKKAQSFLNVRVPEHLASLVQSLRGK